MFVQRYLDGTPVEQDYLDRLKKLTDGAIEAEEAIPLDELEAHANEVNSTGTPAP